MTEALRQNDYAAYESAKDDAKRHESVDAISGLQKFVREISRKASPASELAELEVAAASSFKYDVAQRPGILGEARLVAAHGEMQLLDTGFTQRRSGITYHTGDQASSRDEMVAKIDELFLEGKYAQARGLHENLNDVDSRMVEKGWLLEASVNPQATFEQLSARLAEQTQDVFATASAKVPQINFEAEVLVAQSGIVKTFSTGGGEWYAAHRLALTPSDLDAITPELVESISERNAQHELDVQNALRVTSDQETREAIAMPFIHAVEFGEAIEGYPDGPYRLALKAEVAGMLQYASRLAKYQAGRKYSDDTDIFIETRLGDLAPLNDDAAANSSRTIAEKLIANGVHRQIDIDARAYDDGLWGSYFQEAQKRAS